MRDLRGFRKKKEPYILERARGARSILHVGCTCSPNTELRWNNGTLLHKALCDLGTGAVTGIDIDADAIEWLKARMPGERIFYGDAHDIASALPGEKFDFIIAGDVIEHLPNPGLFLEAAAGALSDDGVLMVTTANTFGVVRFIKAMVGHEAVHDEHTAYYSYFTLKRLAEMIGLRVATMGYYACDPEQWNRGLNGKVSYAMENLICAAWPQFSHGLVAELQIGHSHAIPS